MAAPTSAPKPVSIGGRLVGEREPVLIIAEAGVNHDGELETALGLVEAAAAAGADAVKFQTFDPEQLATAESEPASYQRRGAEDERQRELLERLRLPDEDLAAVAARARERGLTFLSTPFDQGSASTLVQLGVPAFKVGSGEVTNLPFLERLTEHALPILLSTGMSDIEEVRVAARAIQSRRVPLVVLHCTSSYPAPAEEANLRAIDTLRRELDVPVGYSDHTMGLDVSLAAVARDACVLERHLTLDRTRRGPDHAMSLEPSELAELVRRVREVEVWLGTGEKRAQPSESELRVIARRSIVAARTLAAGEVLSEDALAVKRPGDGLPPARLPSLIGRRLARALSADEQVTEGHLERSE